MNTKSIIRKYLLGSVIFILLLGMSLNVAAASEEGLNALSIGEFEKAEAIFSEVLKGDAENREAGYYLGLSLLMQEKFNEALGVFKNLKFSLNNKAVTGSSDIPAAGQVEIGMARSYLGLKKYPEALKSLKAAEKAEADQVDIHTFKGAYYLEINENTKANEELEKALDMKSQNPYTYYYAGIANIRLGHPQKAVKLFEAFLNMAPYTPEAKHAKFLVDTLC